MTLLTFASAIMDQVLLFGSSILTLLGMISLFLLLPVLIAAFVVGTFNLLEKKQGGDISLIGAPILMATTFSHIFLEIVVGLSYLRSDNWEIANLCVTLIAVALTILMLQGLVVLGVGVYRGMMGMEEDEESKTEGKELTTKKSTEKTTTTASSPSPKQRSLGARLFIPASLPRMNEEIGRALDIARGSCNQTQTTPPIDSAEVIERYARERGWKLDTAPAKLATATESEEEGKEEEDIDQTASLLSAAETSEIGEVEEVIWDRDTEESREEGEEESHQTTPMLASYHTTGEEVIWECDLEEARSEQCTATPTDDTPEASDLEEEDSYLGEDFVSIRAL